jgi:steroid 5-alpha reductase family enzyme
VRGWRGFGHEDWRYVELRRKTGALYWLVSFAGLHAFPTIIVFLALFGAYVALVTGREALGLLDAIATIVTICAVLIELVADEQLRRFRDDESNAGKIMDRGLWSSSRHPNYFGEIVFWWGIGLFGLAAGAETVTWVLCGPIAMTALFVFISIPLLDQRSRLRRPEYAAHMRRVSALIPWFRSSPRSARDGGDKVKTR